MRGLWPAPVPAANQLRTAANKSSASASAANGTVPRRPDAPSRATYGVSAALASVAVLTSGASFLFWDVFQRDVPMTVGNMRGTALAMLVIAVPILVGSMILSSRGSLRAQFVWLGSLAYIAYNAVMFCFALKFNSFFLLFVALLALSFWALVTLLSQFDLVAASAGGAGVPVRTVAVYMLACLVLFAMMWLRDIIPATIGNVLPDTRSSAARASQSWGGKSRISAPLNTAPRHPGH